jgi:hypothetical protein
MKGLILATAVAGLAAVSPLSAQGRARTSTINTQSRQDCRNQSSNPVDVILGRGANTSNNCTYNGDRSVDGQWRPISQDRNGNTIYERRTYDRNGNIVVQRAVRDSYGRMSVIDTRTYNGNGNGGWNNGRRNANGKYKNRGHDDGDDDDQGRYNRGRNDDSNYRYDQFGNRIYVGPTSNTNRVYRGSDNRYEQSKHKEHGRGKGKKGRD